MDYNGHGLMWAESPWDGHYTINSPIWVSAHYTQVRTLPRSDDIGQCGKNITLDSVSCVLHVTVHLFFTFPFHLYFTPKYTCFARNSASMFHAVLYLPFMLQQFTKPGWKYLQVGQGSGELAGGGTYVTLVDTSTNTNVTHFTLVLQTMEYNMSQCFKDTHAPFTVAPTQTVTFQLRNAGEIVVIK